MNTDEKPPNVICGHCGYELGYPPLRPCPECGNDKPGLALRRRPITMTLVRANLWICLFGALFFIPHKDGDDPLGMVGRGMALQMVGVGMLIGVLFEFHLWSGTDRRSTRLGQDVMWIWLFAYLFVVAAAAMLIAL